METRICRFLLGQKKLTSLFISLFTACALWCSPAIAQSSSQNTSSSDAQNTSTNVGSIIEPNLQRRDINESNIDTENIEFGVFAGILSVEDFASNSVVGARLAYHINEDLFVEATYGQSQAGQTSFEILSGGAPFLTDEERDYTYYNVALGYNLNGEMFISKDWVFNSATYFTLGAGSTEFGGDDRFTVSLGAGYRLLLTDYFAIHVGFKDHIFNSELIGEEKSTHNIEYSIGTTFFF